MFKKLIATFGGTGLLPAMPGTYGSLAAALIYFGLWKWMGEWARLVALGMVVVAGFAAWSVYGWARAYFGKEDPKQFVLDEAAGQWLTLLAGPISLHALSSVAMGFFLFRAFDISKPYPIDKVEKLHGFWGLFLDDLVAGIYATGVLWIMDVAFRPVLEKLASA